MTNKRYTITSLRRSGKYSVRAAEEAQTDDAVFTSVRGDTVRLTAGGDLTLWEINGFRLHDAVLPLFRFLDTEKIPSCPIAVSDTRLSLLLSQDIAAGQLWKALQNSDTEPAHADIR